MENINKSPKWMSFLLPILIIIVVALTFSPSLDNQFVDLDDAKNIVYNPHYRGLSRHHLQWMFTTFHNGHYHPLTWLSFGADYTLWKMDPRGYHLTNLLLHIANALLLYWLLLILLGKTSSTKPVAAIASLFFAIHPLRVESVVWVTERRDVLSSFFWLLTLICYFKMHLVSSNKKKWYGASLVFYLFSLLSKTWGITLPVILLLLDIYPLKRISHRKDRQAWKRILPEKIPYFLMGGIIACITLVSTQKAHAAIHDHTIWGRLLQAGYGLCFYLWKMIIPLHLVPIYPIIDHNIFSAKFYVCIVLVLLSSLFLFVYRKRYPHTTIAFFCYAIIVSPVLGLVQSGPQIVADRYSYLSCIPLVILFAALLLFIVAKGKKYGWSSFLLSIMVIVGLAGQTFHQSKAWKNSETLWRHIYEQNPASRANILLVRHYIKTNETDKALSVCRDMIAHGIDREILALPMAEICIMQKKYPQARFYLDQTLQSKNATPAQKTMVCYWYARIYRLQKKFAEEEKILRQALQWKVQKASLEFHDGNISFSPDETPHNPDDYAVEHIVHAITYRSLAELYSLQGKRQQTLAAITAGLDHYPEFIGLHISLAFYHEQGGSLRQANAAFRKALLYYLLDLNKQVYSPQGYANITRCAMKAGRPDLTLPYILEALEYYPDHYTLLLCAGTLYAAQKMYDQAQVMFEKALEIRPGDVHARRNLQEIKRRISRKK